MDGSSIIWSFLFGSVGMGYLLYGKKQKHTVALLSGVGLCAFPYFVSNLVLIIITGIVLMALPFIIKS